MVKLKQPTRTYLGAQNTSYVGNFKGVGRLYQQFISNLLEREIFKFILLIYLINKFYRKLKKTTVGLSVRKNCQKYLIITGLNVGCFGVDEPDDETYV